MASSPWRRSSGVSASHDPGSSSAGPSDQPLPDSPTGIDRKKKQVQPRQLLSCSKCRERKVRCDRTKPCSACCARGHPKECQFTLGEGTAFGPIQQSLELRKLRAENQRLKERLLQAKLPMNAESDDDSTPSGLYSVGSRAAQRRFGAEDPTESIYFGSPSLATVISDFAEVQPETRSLSHSFPRGIDMYKNESVTMYPFPTIWTSSTWVAGLYNCLQPWHEVSFYLDAYSRRAEAFLWPHLAQEVHRKEVERFMADFAHNAESYPDMLALIFAALAIGVQTSVYERSGNQWLAGAVERDRLKGDLYVSCCVQALRQACFMSQPTLLNIQALIILGPYLINSGRFLDAWTLLGTTIRSAQALGLHRNPALLSPTPSLRDTSLRKKLWWWLLHIDQQYSMTLGRPLGISGIGDCPFVEPLTTDPAIIRMGECLDQLTIIGRQVLSSAQLTNSRIDQLSDKLSSLLDMLPDEMQFSELWLQNPDVVPEYPLDEHSAVLFCKVHNYLVLLNRQRVANNQAESGQPSPKTALSSINQQSFNPTYSATPQPIKPTETDSLRGRPQVLRSSAMILSAFEFFHQRIPGCLIDWSIGQQAFNASMILLLDIQERRDSNGLPRIESALFIFKELCEKGVHRLAKTAVEHISAETTRAFSLINGEIPIDSVAGQSLTSIYDRRDSQISTSISSHSTPALFHAGLTKPHSDMDSVMANTGMFLSEDRVLQQSTSAFNPERRMSAPAFQTVNTQAHVQRPTQFAYTQHTQHPQQPQQYDVQQSPFHHQYRQAHVQAPYAMDMGMHPPGYNQQSPTALANRSHANLAAQTIGLGVQPNQSPTQNVEPRNYPPFQQNTWDSSN